MCCSVLQCVAVCCSVLQCVAVCCSVLQRVYIAACCSALQCVAMHLRVKLSPTTKGTLSRPVCPHGKVVCCSMLQCVEACCREYMLQCVGTFAEAYVPSRKGETSLLA